MAEHCSCHCHLSFSWNRKPVHGWTNENRKKWKLIMKLNTMAIYCVLFFGAYRVFTSFVVGLPIHRQVRIDGKERKQNIAISLASLTNEYVFQFGQNQPQFFSFFFSLIHFFNWIASMNALNLIFIHIIVNKVFSRTAYMFFLNGYVTI